MVLEEGLVSIAGLVAGLEDGGAEALPASKEANTAFMIRNMRSPGYCREVLPCYPWKFPEADLSGSSDRGMVKIVMVGAEEPSCRWVGGVWSLCYNLCCLGQCIWGKGQQLPVGRGKI